MKRIFANRLSDKGLVSINKIHKDLSKLNSKQANKFPVISDIYIWVSVYKLSFYQHPCFTDEKAEVRDFPVLQLLEGDRTRLFSFFN